MLNKGQIKWMLAHDKLIQDAMDLSIGQTVSPTFSIPRFNIMAQQEVIKKMTAGNTASRMKYLGVEMLKKDATKSSTPEVGLFRGLRERSDGEGVDVKTIKMILLGTKDKPNDLKALNLAVFNVLSLKMLYGDTKELIVFKANDADQSKAMELLGVALEEFQKEQRMVDNDPEIVDVSTFEDVPKEFFAPQEKTNTPGVGSNIYGHYGNNAGYQTEDWKKKEAERKLEKERQEKLRWTPCPIKRADDLPTLKVLNAMKKKVIALVAGESTESLIDPDPEDTFEEDVKKTTIVK